MATTSQQTKVDHESIRILAIQIGVRPAARKLGLNEDTVCSWAKRENWFATPAVTQPITQQALQAKPGDVLLDELADNERETRLSLSRYARRSTKDAESASLRESPYVKQAAQVASIAFKWDQKEQQNNTVVNIALLGVDPASVSVEQAPVIDVEPVVSE